MRHRIPLAALVLTAAAAVSAAALAATPKTGCFGRCGGVPGVGPALMPSLLVQNGHVAYLTFPSYCLGHYTVKVTNGSGTVLRTATWPNMIDWNGRSAMPVSGTGTFSYTGRARLDTASASGNVHVTFSIAGRFRTPTQAAGIVTLDYPGCRKTGFAIRYA